MADQRDKNFVRGLAALAVGAVLAILGALWAHFTGLSELDDVGRELYPAFPRGWLFVLIGQLVSLTGVLIAMAGIALAFLYEKPMTWARSAIGAFLFTGLMIILFGIIPNEWLTYTQAVWEWTDQKNVVTVPASLIGGNDLSLSMAALKDIVAGIEAEAAAWCTPDGGVAITNLARCALGRARELRARRPSEGPSRS